MSYQERIANYLPNEYSESSYLHQLDQAIKACQNEQQEFKIWTMKNWVDTQLNKTTFEKEQKSKQIANRIRIFDGSMSGSDVVFKIKATDRNFVNQLAQRCYALRQAQKEYSEVVFKYLFHDKKEQETQGLGSKYELLVRLDDTEMRSKYNKVQTLHKQRDGKQIKVSSAMIAEAANRIRETDKFEDYKLLIFGLYIDNQSKNEDYRDAVKIEELQNCFFKKDVPIQFSVNSNLFDLEILQKSINNTHYQMKTDQRTTNYIKQVKQLLTRIKKPQSTNSQQNNIRLYYKFQKTFKQLSSFQMSKLTGDFMGDSKPQTYVDTDPYIYELISNIRTPKLEDQLKEFMRRIEVYKFKECREPEDLKNAYPCNLVGSNSQWGIFAKVGNDQEYFIANTIKFSNLYKFQEKIKTARKIFYFEEGIDNGLIQLNMIMERVDSNLKNRGDKEQRILAKKMLFKIKLQICFKTFLDNYKIAVQTIPGSTVKLKSENTNWREVFKGAQFV